MSTSKRWQGCSRAPRTARNSARTSTRASSSNFIRSNRRFSPEFARTPHAEQCFSKTAHYRCARHLAVPRQSGDGAVRAWLWPHPWQRASARAAIVEARLCTTEVKITGVLHEYSALDGVQEDVVDILLNLKGVVLK